MFVLDYTNRNITFMWYANVNNGKYRCLDYRNGSGSISYWRSDFLNYANIPRMNSLVRNFQRWSLYSRCIFQIFVDVIILLLLLLLLTLYLKKKSLFLSRELQFLIITLFMFISINWNAITYYRRTACDRIGKSKTRIGLRNKLRDEAWFWRV